MTRLRAHLLTCLLAAALAPPAAADVVISIAVPQDGPQAAAGAEIARAVNLAAERINAEGGVMGERISVTEDDDGCVAGSAEATARAIVALHAALVIGHPCASTAIAAAPIYGESHVPFIAPATRHPALTEPRAGPTVFRLAGRDDRQGASAGAYLARTYAASPLAVVHDGSRYAKTLAKDALAALKAAGRDDILTATVSGGQKDYAPLVAKLAAAHTSALLFAGFPLEGGSLLRQMRAAGLETVFIGGDALATPQFAQTAGEAATGAGALLPHDPARTLSPEKLRAAFGARTPTGPFVSAYAAVEAWRAAAQAVHSLEPEAVSGALAQGPFETVLGPVAFDAAGDANVPSYDIVWWEDGTWRAKNLAR